MRPVTHAHRSPAPPEADAEPVFGEPWQAHAFAIVLQLHERGLFSWPEWARVLAAEIDAARQRGEADLGDTYYRHWLGALESILADKGASTAVELARYRDAWDHAAERTPHGEPIALEPRDFKDR